MPLSPKDFTYEFPQELIAKYPVTPRDASRLLIVNRRDKTTKHTRFKNIADYFNAGDVLVFNNTKVFPCRLITQRKTGGRQEIFLLHSRGDTATGTACRAPTNNEIWSVMLNASGKINAGDVFEFDGLTITIQSDHGNIREARLDYNGDLMAILNRIAHMPLPPYINRDDEPSDRDRYQTVFAKTTGSVAAPTAGLHFTPQIIEELKERGVIICEVTLHVGLGTFLPVKVDDIAQHEMHSEVFSIDEDTCSVLNLAKSEGRKITAVGTTVARVLETIANAPVGAGSPRPQLPQFGRGDLAPTTDSTNIFIYPPYEFKMIDRLITNFHQPESTLLMLVSAFAGREFILSAYDEAIKNQYRLFSYGDVMMIS